MMLNTLARSRGWKGDTRQSNGMTGGGETNRNDGGFTFPPLFFSLRFPLTLFFRSKPGPFTS